MGGGGALVVFLAPCAQRVVGSRGGKGRVHNALCRGGRASSVVRTTNFGPVRNCLNSQWVCWPKIARGGHVRNAVCHEGKGRAHNTLCHPGREMTGL